MREIGWPCKARLPYASERACQSVLSRQSFSEEGSPKGKDGNRAFTPSLGIRMSPLCNSRLSQILRKQKPGHFHGRACYR